MTVYREGAHITKAMLDIDLASASYVVRMDQQVYALHKAFNDRFQFNGKYEFIVYAPLTDDKGFEVIEIGSPINGLINAMRIVNEQVHTDFDEGIREGVYS